MALLRRKGDAGMYSEEQQEKANALCDLLAYEPEKLAAALEGVEPEKLPWVWHEGNGYFDVLGSVLAVAAAKNRTAHMTLLLDRGWDVEGGVGPEWMTSRNLGTSPASPLSAAILGGSVEAARLLLERGAKSWDCAAVCRTALLLLDWEDGRYVPCIRTALGLGEDADVRGELLRRVPPHWILENCTPEDLRVCLRSRRHDAADLVRTIQMTGSRSAGNAPFHKLLVLSEEAPEGFRELRERDQLLSAALTVANCMIPAEWNELDLAMLAQWRELSGSVRDISAALHFLQTGRPEDARTTLTLLKKGADELIADANAFLFYGEDGNRNNGMILRALTRMYVPEDCRENFLDRVASHPDLLLRILRAHLLDRELEHAAVARAVSNTKNIKTRTKLLAELSELST